MLFALTLTNSIVEVISSHNFVKTKKVSPEQAKKATGAKY
jgi:hypothetical protein